MSKIYVVSDAKQVLDEIGSALDFVSQSISRFQNYKALLNASSQTAPDLVVADMQVGHMGGMAIAMDLHLEESGGRLPHIPILLLLDRRADVFLARRSNVEGFLVKPLDSFRIADAANAILSGGTYEDPSFKPVSIPVP
ncbi:MAG: response regulator [Actinomycetota bacterium]|nr:response regulator [Actinomycetota bacterium]